MERSPSSTSEWHSHYPSALKAGLSPSVAEEVARGKRPASMKSDEAAVYDLCTDSIGRMQQATPHGAALLSCSVRSAHLLITALGYYSMIAMILNVNQTPLPGNASAPIALQL